MADGVEIRISTPGSKSLGEMRDEVKQLKKALQELIPGTQAFTSQSKLIAATQDKVNVALKGGWSESARMKDAYFRAGLEVRQLFLNSNLLGGSLGKASEAIQSSVINAVQLNRVLIPLGLSMGGVGIAVTAAVSVLPALIDLFNKGSESTKKFTERLTSMRDALVSSGDPQLLKDEEERLRIAARSEKNEDNKIEMLRRANDLESAYNNILKERGKILGPTGKALAEKQRVAEGDRLAAMQFGDLQFYGATKSQLTQAFSDKNKPKGYTAADEAADNFQAKLLTGKSTSEVFQDEILPKGEKLGETLKASAKTFSHTLIDALIQGQDIAQSIGMALLGILINFGTDYLSGGITSFFNKTGSGGRMNEPVLSAQGTRSLPMFSPGQLVATTMLKGTDIIVAIRRASPVLKTSTYGQPT